MSGFDWPGWITAVATVVGLVIVVVQLIALNSQARLQTYTEYTKRYADIVEKFPEDINSPGFSLAGRDDYDSVMRQMRAYFDLCFEEWDLRQKNLISSDFWETWRTGAKTALSKPAFQQAWSKIKQDSVFGAAFENFVDELKSS